MSNTERLIWLSILILGGFFYQNQVFKLESLELLNQQAQISSNLKDDQVIELLQKTSLISSERYNEGFEAGRTQAMIASVNGSNILEYKDGYHAALSQFDFSSSIEKEEIKNLLSSINNKDEKSSNLYLKLSNLVY